MDYQGIVGTHIVGYSAHSSRDISLRSHREIGGSHSVVVNDIETAKVLIDDGATVIFRLKNWEFDDDNLHQHAPAALYLTRVDALTRAHGCEKAYLYWNNEPGNQDLPVLKRELHQALVTANRLGRILVVLNIAYRNWSITDWDYLAEELQMIVDGGHFVGVHEGYHKDFPNMQTAMGECIGRFIPSMRKYGFKVIVTEFAASWAPDYGWSKWLTVEQWATLLRDAVRLVYSKYGIPVCIFTLYEWLHNFDYVNAPELKQSFAQINRDFPKPEVVMPGVYIEDTSLYFCPPNGKSLHLGGIGDENCRTIRAEDGWYDFLKNRHKEAFRVTATTIDRGEDTSMISKDGVHPDGIFYIQYTVMPDGSLSYGCPWAPRQWTVGQKFKRKTRIIWRHADGRKIDGMEYDEDSYLLFLAYHATYHFKTGVTLNDVIEVVWVGMDGKEKEEHYFYAKHYGLAAWINVKHPEITSCVDRLTANIMTPFPLPASIVRPIAGEITVVPIPNKRIRIIGFPPDITYRNIRAEASGTSVDLGDLVVGEVVTAALDAQQNGFVYLEDTAGVKGWVLWNGVAWEAAPIAEPPIEPQTVTLTIEQYHRLATLSAGLATFVLEVKPPTSGGGF